MKYIRNFLPQFCRSMMINQKWSPEAYHHAGSFVPDLASDLLNDLNPKRNEKILDLGCGNGVLTKKILQSTKNVVGVDSSDAMVQAAKEIGIDSYLIDGEAIPYRNVFDAVFSNAVLHWIQNQDAVLRGVHKCLKPKGRFVGEFGGFGNISSLIGVIERVMDSHSIFDSFNNPWYFPTTQEYQKKLTDNGFCVKSIDLIQRPTFLKTDLKDWLKVFASHITSSMSTAVEDLFLREVQKAAETKLFSESTGWVLDYVRLRFYAVKIK